MKRVLLLFILLALFGSSYSAQTNEPVKVDDVANEPCDDYLGRTIIYVNKLKQTAGAKGYVIIYEGKTVKGLYDKHSASYDMEKYVLPRFGLAQELIKTIKERLTLLGVSDQKTIFINGGFREKLSIELWIVPDAAKPPGSTPILDKIPYRKGSPRGYCVEI